MIVVRDIVTGLVGITGTDILLAGFAVAGAKLEFIDEAEVLDERFLVKFPGDGRGREIAPAGFRCETGGCIGTHRKREQVLVPEDVIQAAEPGGQAEFGLAGGFQAVFDRVPVIVEGGGTPGLAVVTLIGVADGCIDGMLPGENMLVIQEVVDVVMETVGRAGGVGSLTALSEGDHGGRPGARGVVTAQVLGVGVVFVPVEGNGRGQILKTMDLVNGGNIRRETVVLAVAQARIQGAGHLVGSRDRVVALGIGTEHVESKGLLVIVHAVDRGRTIVGVDRSGRVCQRSGSDGTAAFRGALVVLAQADVEGQMVVQELRIEVDRSSPDILLVALHDTLAVLETDGNAVRKVRQGTPEGNGMTVVEGRLADGLLPVGIRIAQQGGIPPAADVLLTEFIGIVDIEFLIGIVDGIVATVGYARRDGLSAFGLRTFLGRDDDDAVGTPGTIDGRG